MRAKPCSERLRIILADDSPGLIEELICLLEPDCSIAASVKDGNALVETAERLRPDVVVSDYDMPGLNGLEAGRIILRKGFCSAVVLLTIHGNAELIYAAVAAGIRGYVVKTDAGDELIEAVRRVASGETYFSRSAARYVAT